jgi:Outer membrane lipoprotein-sorting protein
MSAKALAVIIFFSISAKADLASDLLKASDAGRGGLKDGLSWKSKVTTIEDGETSVREFLVKAKESNAYIDSLAPARTRGEIYIFNDRSMWFFKASLKKPVSISPRQKLSGQAANGDIASTHYARDYIASIEKTEIVDGEKMHVLMLKAKASNLTYDQIRYWVSDKTKLAMKAEFLTLQGKVFKIGKMEYKNTLNHSGKENPFVSKVTIVDAKFPENKSILEYEKPKLEDHSASIFNVNNLAR